jgi:hypothetical protein
MTLQRRRLLDRILADGKRASRRRKIRAFAPLIAAVLPP